MAAKLDLPPGYAVREGRDPANVRYFQGEYTPTGERSPTYSRRTPAAEWTLKHYAEAQMAREGGKQA